MMKHKHISNPDCAIHPQRYIPLKEFMHLSLLCVCGHSNGSHSRHPVGEDFCTVHNWAANPVISCDCPYFSSALGQDASLYA